VSFFVVAEKLSAIIHKGHFAEPDQCTCNTKWKLSKAI